MPTPGAIDGSQASRSNETWIPPVPADASGDRALGHPGHPVAIDVLHREDVDAGGADLILLAVVQVADADEHGVLRRHRGAVADGGELARLLAEQRGQRHAVNVAALGRVGGVHVAVGVHPDEAQRVADPCLTQAALAATEPAARL